MAKFLELTSKGKIFLRDNPSPKSLGARRIKSGLVIVNNSKRISEGRLIALLVLRKPFSETPGKKPLQFKTRKALVRNWIGVGLLRVSN